MDWLDSFLKFETPPFSGSHLNGPARPGALHKVESTLAALDRLRGFTFPPSYKALLEVADGGVVRDITLNGILEMWDDEQPTPADEYQSCVTFFACDTELRPLTSLLAYNSEASIPTNEAGESYADFRSLVFFAMDERGKFWAFDWMSRYPDGEMPVVYCDDVTGKVFPQAEDFAEFIGLITGRKLLYRHHTDGGIVSFD